jgi:hypothetical protein
MRNRRSCSIIQRLSVLLIALTLGVAAGVAAQPAAASTAGPTLTGMVWDQFSHPLGGILVEALDPVTAVTLASDTTYPGDGSFRLLLDPAPAAGEYKVRFSDPAGVFTTTYFRDQSSLATAQVLPSRPRTEDLGIIRLPTSLTGTLAGTVRNTAGAALQGMTVRAYQGNNASEITATTAADGSYAFTGLEVGAGTLFALRFSNPNGDYLPLDYDANPATIFNPEAVKVVAGKTTTADAVMRRSCTLSGVVTDSRTHRPVVGVQVWPALAPGQPPETDLYLIYAGTTDATGAYEATDFPDGVYVVACGGPPPVYGMQYWPAASTPETATQVTLTPSAPSAVADVVLRHDSTRPTTAALNNVTMRTRNTARFKFRVTDAYGTTARLTLFVANSKGKVRARVKLGTRPINITDGEKWDPVGFSPGKYTWWVTATDLAGNAQSRIIKKALVLKR